MRRMDYVHINGEGELIERPKGMLVDYSSYVELQEALRRYGKHDQDCAHNHPYSPPRGFARRPCSCGFSAASQADGEVDG